MNKHFHISVTVEGEEKTGHSFICISVWDLMEIKMGGQRLCPLWQVF